MVIPKNIDKGRVRNTYRTRKSVPESEKQKAKEIKKQTPNENGKICRILFLDLKKKLSKNKLEKRKFFTAKEDALILTKWLEKKNKDSSRAISDALAKEIDHSSESIRDRIKRYLSRLSQVDEGFLIDQAKVTFPLSLFFKKNFLFFKHFLNELLITK